MRTLPMPRRLLARARTAGAALALGAAAGLAPAHAATVVGDGLVLACSQPQPQTLRCDYRVVGSGLPLAAVATMGEVTLPAPAFAARTGTPGDTGVLLLVDTSDPARAPAMRKIARHIERLVERADPQLRFGLASFDSNLTLLAPIGSDAETLKAAAAGLEARGRTTELYRNVVDALKRLATASVEHKVLMVFSDGLAEDRAYFHADAVDEALRNRIAVYGVGYPRSVALSVALQSLRRLADDTGGRFTAADAQFDLPEAFFDAPFAAVRNVGALSVDLSDAADAQGSGTQSVRVALETGAGPVSALVPVTFPARAPSEPIVKVVEVEVPRVVEVERVVEVPVAAPQPVPAAAAPPPPAGVPLWYWIAAIGLLALALLVLLLVLLLQRRTATSSAAAAPPAPLTGLAYLTLAVGGDVHPINSATYRIGRLGDNDLVLRDPSVSRHHAEIRRRRDGGFQILDLDSMNGILVNGTKVREADLDDGASVEIGDVRMAFAVEASADLVGEETVMMKTVLPEMPFPEAAGGRR